jgi:hypothetical protein
MVGRRTVWFVPIVRLRGQERRGLLQRWSRKIAPAGCDRTRRGCGCERGTILCPCAGVGADAVELDSLYTRCVLSVPSYEGCCPFGTMDLPLSLVAKICNDNELARGDRLCLPQFYVSPCWHSVG